MVGFALWGRLLWLLLSAGLGAAVGQRGNAGRASCLPDSAVIAGGAMLQTASLPEKELASLQPHGPGSGMVAVDLEAPLAKAALDGATGTDRIGSLEEEVRALKRRVAALETDRQKPTDVDIWRRLAPLGTVNTSNASNLTGRLVASVSASRSSSVETTLKDGKIVRTITTCTNGNCTSKQVEHNATIHANASNASIPSMNKLEEGLEDVFGDVFGRSVLRGLRGDDIMWESWTGNATAEKSLAGRSGIGQELGDIFGSDAMRGIRGDAIPWTEVMANMSAGMSSSSTAVSTSIEDGKVVKRIRKCKDGHCATKVAEQKSLLDATVY